MKLTLNARDLKRLTQEVHAMHKASHMSLPLQHAALQSRLRVLTRRRVQVNHPNCVKIFSASLKACDPFIVMEWMEGGSWYDALGLDPPPLPTTASRLRARLRARLHTCTTH